MTYGVYATMNSMQSASSNAPLDSIVGNPSRPELRNRQHPILTFSNPADALVACGVFLVDMTYKSPQHTESPPGILV
jgi:hypothetical protein